MGPSIARATAAALALLAAACTDRANPVAPVPVPSGPTPAAPIILAGFDCTADVRTPAVTCTPAAQRTPGETDIVPGNSTIELTSSNAAYDGATQEYTFDVTVQNLIPQPIGTADGTTLAPTGVRAFFNSGPTVTSGSGTITVVADGVASFTAAGQPYSQYNQVLVDSAVSSLRTWTLHIPATVTGFTFTLYVSAPVQYPDGYVTLNGRLPGSSLGSLAPGDSHPLTAVVRSAAGATLSGTVTFATSDANCATVDATGLVTAVRSGTCTITATSGTRQGSATLLVAGITRNWTGAVSTDWNVGANWTGGVVPATTDSVVIPTGVPRYPVLTSSVSVGGVTVADGATLDVAGFTLTVSASVATGSTAGSGIVASGSGMVSLTGVAKVMHGRLPRATVTGTYALDGAYWGPAPQAVDAGRITVTGFPMTIG
jgi:hypothetical protein